MVFEADKNAVYAFGGLALSAHEVGEEADEEAEEDAEEEADEDADEDLSRMEEGRVRGR